MLRASVPNELNILKKSRAFLPADPADADTERPASLAVFASPLLVPRADECNGFLCRIDAVRNIEILRAGELKFWPQQILTPPFDEIGPHAADEYQRGPMQFADLKELPDHRQFQHCADPAGYDDECVRYQYEVMQPREESAMLSSSATVSAAS